MAPIVYRLASAIFYNLSLLTAKSFGLLFRLFLFICLFDYVVPLAPDNLIQIYSITDRSGCTLWHSPSSLPGWVFISGPPHLNREEMSIRNYLLTSTRKMASKTPMPP
ncbi:hypothetical protein BJ322DRAFT_1108221 [Thelephora terrestris]|uniref:Uncharacterized protein n=1 Tax=Thelephora terrestris TaxID=56493 RepID=A0A9P6L875_9AGAM|nr:hypothetical protein BJ322DRAFT_1108221 [Thelephora terrestris]